VTTSDLDPPATQPDQDVARLRARVAALEDAAARLRESEARYRSLVLATAQIVWTTDPNGAVVADLPLWQAYTGRATEDLKGWGWLADLHPDDRERTRAVWEHAVATRSHYEIEYRLRRRDGVYEWVVARGVPVLDDAGQIREWVGTCTNIQARQEADAALLWRDQQLELLSSMAQQINSVLEIPVILGILVASAMELVRASGGTAGLLESGAVVFHEYNARGEIQPLDYRCAPGEDVAGRVLQTRRYYLTQDAAHDPQAAPAYPQRAAAGRLLVVPIFSRTGDPIGCLELHAPPDGAPFREEDVPLVQGLAASAAVAIENALTLEARDQVEDALRDQLNFTRAITNSLGEGVYALDSHGRLAFMNPAAEEMLGWQAAELLGRHLHEIVHFQRADGTPIPADACPLLNVLHSGVVLHIDDDYYTRKDGTVLPVAYTSAPILAGARVAGAVVVFHDMTERRRAEAERAALLAREQAARAEAEAAQTRLAFLAEASATLGTSLDYRTILATFARLVVPHIADWCAIDAVAEDGTIHRVAVAHIDPDKVAWAREINERYPIRPDSPRGVAAVIRSGAPQIFSDVSDGQLTAHARDGDHLALLRALGMRSVMLVPLVARERTLGAVTLMITESDRRYGPADLALAGDLARRAALAVDNARLFSDLQDAVRAREEFLSIASHELKTPLTSLQLQVQMLQRAAQKDTLARLPADRVLTMLGTAERQTKHLVKLINTLLDISRVSGHLELRREEIDLAAVVRDVAAQLEPELAVAGCRLTVDAPAPVVGAWDRARLEQVVTNLLSNAGKYGRGQPIAVTLTGTGDRARLVVRDQGIGIAPEHLGRIFERFERAVSAHNYGGLGLGLYIVRQIVEAHGGTIAVTSTPGAGSTFVVDLPRHAEG
jgi:PAS domain S-box-containing protein